MGHAAGVVSKEAQRFGLHLPKLMVQLREFEAKSLLRLDPNCFKDKSGSPSCGKKLLS